MSVTVTPRTSLDNTLNHDHPTLSESDNKDIGVVIGELESVARARIRYANLMDIIADLSNKVSEVGQRHEQDFLSAYRIHQVNIQLELRELKAKVASAQESLSIDGDVAKQEEECAWFRSETSRLDSHYKNMKHDMKSMLSRLETLREQVAYLSEQLKSVMKRTKILEAEIKVFDSENYDKSSQNPQKTKKSDEILKKSVSETAFRKVPLEYTEEKLQRLKMSQSRNSLKLNTMTKSLNRQVQRDLQFMEQSRSTFDIELEDSIMIVLNDILKRRSEAVVRSLKSRKKLLNPVEANTSPQGYFDEQISDKCNDVGITGLGLQNFLPTDKFNAIVHYLSKIEIFDAVTERLMQQQV